MKDGKPPLAAAYRDPIRMFQGHDDNILAIARFPDGKKIVTGSVDETIRIWRVEDGREMKKWAVKKAVRGLVILKDGKKVISAEGDIGGKDWKLWVRDAQTGGVVAGPLDGHTHAITYLDISPDDGIVASSSFDSSVILWDTITWQRKGSPLECGATVNCIKFSPTGSQLGAATDNDIQIWDLDRREQLAKFNGLNKAWNLTLAWTHDGTNLLSAGDDRDTIIRCWDTSTWKQVGDPWTGHDDQINHVVLNSACTLLASASDDYTVRLWQISTATEVARYEHSEAVFRLAFSVDERFILSGGRDKKISQWEIPEGVLAAAHSDYIARELKDTAVSALGKPKNTRSHLDMVVPGQRRNITSRHLGSPDRSRPWAGRAAVESAADTGSLSSSRVNGVKNLFNRIRPLSNKKGKQKQRQQKADTPEAVDVPLGQATYGDYVASKEDGIRPYSLFFCLSWFRKKEKKPDPPPQLYDVDFMEAEQGEDILDVPAPTTSARFAQLGHIEMTPMASHSQAEAEPSRLADTAGRPGGLSS